MKSNKAIVYIMKVIIIISIILLPNNSYAMNVSDELGNDLTKYGTVQNDSPTFEKKVGVIIGVIQTLGSAISLIALIVLGIRYMMGSVEEKAEYKKTLLPYALGALMVFGISNLLSIVYDISQGIF